MNVAIIILNVFIIHSPASTVYDKPVCYLNNLIKKKMLGRANLGHGSL